MKAGRLGVVVEADGGARGNPGPAGYGAVVREADTGEVLAERSAALGVATNNVAEYSGLIAGLKAAAELGAATVEVRMDSKLVVEQMSGRWQIKHPGLRPLAAQAAGLVRRFDSVTFGWIPRERNKHADALANAAMDAAAGRAGTAAGQVGTGAGRADATADRVGTGAGRADAAAGAGGADAYAGRAPDAATAGTDGRVAPRTASRSPGREQHRSPGQEDRSDPKGDGSGRSPVGPSAAVGPPATAVITAEPPPAWERNTDSAADRPTRLILVRHGETELTAQRRYSGRGDVPLSERGLAQVRATARRVAVLAEAAPGPVAAVVTSPLCRCTRTAQVIAEAVGSPPVRTEPDLIECDFGEWEALTFTEVRQRWPEQLTAWLASASVAPPGGESFVAVGARVGRVQAALREAYPGSVVVLVSHVSPLKVLLRDALAASDDFLFRLYLDPAGLSIVDSWPDGGVSVRTVNDTAHLAP